MFVVRSGLRRRRRRGAGPSASGASRGCGVGEHACQDTRREPLYRRQDGRRARHRVLVQALHVQRTVYFLPRGDRPQYGVRADPGPFARTRNRTEPGFQRQYRPVRRFGVRLVRGEPQLQGGAEGPHGLQRTVLGPGERPARYGRRHPAGRFRDGRCRECDSGPFAAARGWRAPGPVVPRDGTLPHRGAQYRGFGVAPLLQHGARDDRDLLRHAVHVRKRDADLHLGRSLHRLDRAVRRVAVPQGGLSRVPAVRRAERFGLSVLVPAARRAGGPRDARRRRHCLHRQLLGEELS